MKLIEATPIFKIELIDVKLLRDSWAMDLVVEPGQAFAISGDMERKTGFLRCLSALDEPYAGKVCINDINISELAFEELSKLRRNLGYFFPLGGLLTSKTLRDNLMLPFLHYRANYTSSEKLIYNVLKEFELQKYQDKLPFEVPGIARKLACVARLKVMDPQVLLLEGLFDGINPNVQSLLATWINNKIESGGIVFLSETDALIAKVKNAKALYVGDSSQERVTA